ncbi:uncharacterized protein LOC116115048 [Pistacia vera]|uniref:uncharacterized protein LOC116115048 n=1 Tax=Pistacia vera TaxID=55513 RepID=UPI001263DA77|nr:uncharacterized protein LOC116115048 [Pistacia vera]
MKPYDVTTDPDDHIASYKQWMSVASIPRDLREACMCKSFGSSLLGSALQWYTNLPNNTISSFAQLTDTFIEQFASNKKLEKLSADLYRVYHKRDEPLREYVSHFNKEKISIPSCLMESCKKTLPSLAKLNGGCIGLSSNPNQVGKRMKPTGCDIIVMMIATKDVKTCVQKLTFMNHIIPLSLVALTITIEKCMTDNLPAQIDTHPAPPPPPPPPRSKFQITSSTLTQLMAIMKDIGQTVKYPTKLDLDVERDTFKWSEFDHDHGHNTADYIGLRLDVVALLKSGHLRDIPTNKGKYTLNQRSNNGGPPSQRSKT